MDAKFLAEKAVRLAETGCYSEALRIFDKNVLSTLSPRAQSFYALSMATAAEDYDRAVNMCITAAAKEFYNPEIYLNLGKILVLSGKKTRALKAFKKGLRFDEANVSIKEEIKRLGHRRTPAISFLSRGNVVNRFFGIVSYKVSEFGVARTG